MHSAAEIVKLILKIVLTVVLGFLSLLLGLAFLIYLLMRLYLDAFVLLLVPGIIPILWMKRKKPYLIVYGSVALVFVIIFGIRGGSQIYENHITIDATPNINVEDYLPFDEDSKIVKYDRKTLQLTEDLPIIDGASAAFPVYSAFVNAVYPDTTELYDGVFEYSNTVGGYYKLAQRKIDIFIGAQPSREQLEFAEECGTTYEYTQIGAEAFVFFVHKDNPIESLTAEQLRGIYAGEITNWREVGGNDEEIIAFQRDEGSGSQSMMLRFMGDTPLMDAETREVSGMGGVIEEVVDYQNKSGSIGYSFRFYIEGIIRNPDVKMIAVDGIAPTATNIKNSSYPIGTPVYAGTYAGNPTGNVDRLIEWIVSDEGQYIIEATGYVGLAD